MKRLVFSIVVAAVCSIGVTYTCISVGLDLVVDKPIEGRVVLVMPTVFVWAIFLGAVGMVLRRK